MSHFFSLILLTLLFEVGFAQPVTREQMKLTDRLSKDQLSAGYQTSITGWIVKKGDSLMIGRGSMPDKRFAFIYESPVGFAAPAPTMDNRNNRQYLGSAMSGQRVLIKDLFQYGTKRTGYTMIAKVGAGSIINFWIEIDNAVEAGELLAPLPLRTSVANGQTGSRGSVADELKKWKDLLDSGAINKDEYETQKKKLLSQP